MSSDWRTGSRTERFEYQLYGLDFSPRGMLDGVESCRLQGSVWADIRWGGSLTWSGTSPVDWPRVMVQPWYAVEGAGRWPLGTYLCKSPQTEHHRTVPLATQVDLYDVTYLLAKRSRLPAPLSLPSGTVVTTAITAQLTAASIARYAVTPSAETLAAPMAWDAGEARLRVVNDLAGAIGYWSASADPYGVVTVEPYVDPAARSTAWTFAPGAAAVYSPQWTDRCDDFDTPNRLSGVQRVTDGVTPLTYTATLDALDPTSPYAFAARGYWVDGETMRDADAATAAALKTAVDRRLLQAAGKVHDALLSHAWLPEVALGSVVTFAPDDAVRRFTVAKQEMDLETGLTVQSEWREVTA